MKPTKIQYTDKTNQTPIVDRTKQATADDFNEIKVAVNEVIDTIEAQYIYMEEETSGLRSRIGMRDESGDHVLEVVFDRELTVDGFSGTKGVDWIYIGGFQ